MRGVMAAYLRRDWLVWSSYRFNAVWQLMAIIVLVGVVLLIGRSLGNPDSELLGPSTDYVSFILAGLAFTDTFLTGLTAPPRVVRDEQVSGTLEPILLTPISAYQLFLGSLTFAMVQALFRASLIVGVATTVLGYWPNPNVIAAALVFVPGCLTFIGMGMLAASAVVLVKQGEALVMAYVAVSGILGGTLFPVEALPGWLRPVGALLPLTHGLAGMRLTLEGAPIADVLPAATVLWALAAVLLPAGLLAGRLAIARSKREGTLVHY